MYDIITIGSASVDVFVKTKGEILKHAKHLDMCYHLGDKLLIEDLIFTTGGGGTNTAVAFSRLGLKTGFVGVVGDDFNGEAITRELAMESVHFLGKRKKGKSGYSVILSGLNDRTILTYKGVNNNLTLNDVDFRLVKSKWLYLGTMLGDSFDTIEKIAAYGKKNKMRIAFNISLYLAEQGIRKLASFLNQVDILVLNKEEAMALVGNYDVDRLMEAIAKYVSGIIVITDGSNTVHAYDGKSFYMKKVKKVSTVVDTTGAGDAFASGFVYGIMKGKNIDTALEYGCKESAAIIQCVGAKEKLLRWV